MGDAAEKLLDEALELPEDERIDLAVRILESARPDAKWEEAWLVELRRRVASGAMAPTDWAAMRSRLLDGLRRT